MHCPKNIYRKACIVKTVGVDVGYVLLYKIMLSQDTAQSGHNICLTFTFIRQEPGTESVQRGH